MNIIFLLLSGHSPPLHLSRILKSLAVQSGLPVLVTNNVVSDSKASIITGGIKPALGQTWSHIPNTRVFIQKGQVPSNDKQVCERIATVTKSSRQPVQISTTFYIQTAGILDIPHVASKNDYVKN
ncbi:DNA repair protein RAD51 homolog 4 [Exaiptasia diaphana]|uniref:Rad51-like C-terminal domain-containing protein n=1 Tax=Exaiptasia diaphana TaxID=2652724 RepID=A0A913YUR8_EXADI|nr:DNA repair protein RAD51 homolog 4 [Exaiptasia diaphana]